MNTKTGAYKAAIIVAAGAIFAALVAAVTLTIAIPIPATSGYFNFGETLIYVAALLFGPFVGAIAGAGASLADLLLGYGIFAPGTLVIKGVEGCNSWDHIHKITETHQEYHRLRLHSHHGWRFRNGFRLLPLRTNHTWVAIRAGSCGSSDKHSANGSRVNSCSSSDACCAPYLPTA